MLALTRDWYSDTYCTAALSQQALARSRGNSSSGTPNTRSPRRLKLHTHSQDRRLHSSCNVNVTTESASEMHGKGQGSTEMCARLSPDCMRLSSDVITSAESEGAARDSRQERVEQWCVQSVGEVEHSDARLVSQTQHTSSAPVCSQQGVLGFAHLPVDATRVVHRHYIPENFQKLQATIGHGCSKKTGPLFVPEMPQQMFAEFRAFSSDHAAYEIIAHVPEIPRSYQHVPKLKLTAQALKPLGGAREGHDADASDTQGEVSLHAPIPASSSFKG